MKVAPRPGPAVAASTWPPRALTTSGPGPGRCRSGRAGPAAGGRERSARTGAQPPSRPGRHPDLRPRGRRRYRPAGHGRRPGRRAASRRWRCRPGRPRPGAAPSAHPAPWPSGARRSAGSRTRRHVGGRRPGHLSQARFVLCQQQAFPDLVGSHAHPGRPPGRARRSAVGPGRAPGVRRPTRPGCEPGRDRPHRRSGSHMSIEQPTQQGVRDARTLVGDMDHRPLPEQPNLDRDPAGPVVEGVVDQDVERLVQGASRARAAWSALTSNSRPAAANCACQRSASRWTRSAASTTVVVLTRPRRARASSSSTVVSSPSACSRAAAASVLAAGLSARSSSSSRRIRSAVSGLRS